MKKRNEDRIVNGYQLIKGQPWYAAIGSNVDPRCFNIIFHNMVNVFFNYCRRLSFHWSYGQELTHCYAIFLCSLEIASQEQACSRFTWFSFGCLSPCQNCIVFQARSDQTKGVPRLESGMIGPASLLHQ